MKERIVDKNQKGSFPKWLFAVLTVCGLLASGIYIGIMTVEGATDLRLLQAAGFGLLGLLMFWGALHKD